MDQSTGATPAVVRHVTITVDGRDLTCPVGTSLAAALWNQGIRVLSHSHKYGSPRGVSCARGHCTNCLMRINGIPNVRTCTTPLREGMVVTTQSTGPVYAGPMQHLLSLGRRWVPVGFYYKWFTKPASLSRFFLARIRPMAGVGRLPDAPRSLPAITVANGDNDGPKRVRYTTVIVGGGPSGLSAAQVSSGSTLLIDEGTERGGQRWPALAQLATGPQPLIDQFPLLAAAHSRIKTLREATSHPDLSFRGRTTAIAGYPPNLLVIRHQDRLSCVNFDHLVWAAGALDTIGLFPGNDTPGIIGPRALYRLLTRDGLHVAGQRAIVVGCGLDFWLSAALLATHGATLDLVITEPSEHIAAATAMSLHWTLSTGLKLSNISGAPGGTIEAAFVPRRCSPLRTASQLRVEADLAVICRQGKPVYDIPHQLGADLVLAPDHGGYVPRDYQSGKDGSFHQPIEGAHSIVFTGGALGQPLADRPPR